MDHIIDGIFTLVAGFGGYLIARWQFNSQQKLDAEEKKFLLLYRPYFTLCSQRYYIDVVHNFSELERDDQENILSILCEYDYLATKGIQRSIYNLRKIMFIPEPDEGVLNTMDKEFDFINSAMTSEYERICGLLGYTP